MEQNEELKSAKTLGIAALITGFVAAPIGIILGHISLGKYKKLNGPTEGKGLALTGLIAGYIITTMLVLSLGSCALLVKRDTMKQRMTLHFNSL